MLKWCAAVIALVALLGPAGSLAADVVINNGETPTTNPANVIEDATYASDRVFVRNLGCPPQGQSPFADCPSAGTRTRVAMRPGGETAGVLVYDTSHAEISDGTIWNGELATHQTASANMTGGTVERDVYAYDDSTIWLWRGSVGADLVSFFNSQIQLRGGTVAGDAIALGTSTLNIWGGVVSGSIFAADTATVRIFGDNFQVDGQPVPFGPISAASGTLTGLLSTGESINNAFQVVPPSGTIELVEACIDADNDTYGINTSDTCVPGSFNDCNDNDPDMFPSNPEICDGKDNDCNLQVDDNVIDPDVDMDGYAPGVGCTLPGGDCDDGDPDVFPGNPELCDGKDNNCVGGVDELLDDDSDGDGYSHGVGCLLPGGDCDDNQVTVFPGNPEVCDGLDNDCNLSVDDGVDIDVDGDGVALGSGCLLPGADCDDTDPANYPGNTESCDGQDNDCNVSVDEGLDPDLDGDGFAFGVGCLLPGLDCDDGNAAAFPGNPEVCDGADNDCNASSDDGLDPDLDGDGYTSAVGCLLPGADCDDANAARFPANPEICDGLDNDCNLSSDDGLDPDLDGDGFTSAAGCLLPGADCDDADASSFPGNPEVCDGVDNDCNVVVDDGIDTDVDGDGVALGTGCLLPGGDCDDANPVNYPGNSEVCDGQDNDCTLIADDGLDPDVDGDGYTSAAGCLLPGVDCDDAEAAAYPGNAETCDDIDNDCDGVVDDSYICLEELPMTTPTGIWMLATLLCAIALMTSRRFAEAGD